MFFAAMIMMTMTMIAQAMLVDDKVTEHLPRGAHSKPAKKETTTAVSQVLALVVREVMVEEVVRQERRALA